MGIDGTYVHTAPRKTNKKSDRIDYRLKENQNHHKRCVIVACEHYTPVEKSVHKKGAKHTQVLMTYAETANVVKKFIQEQTKINTDENCAYEVLMPFNKLCTVIHKEKYCIFSIENNEYTPSQKNFDSIRKQLNKFHKDGIITRIQIDFKTVYWQWKN
ncbi:hypothetical protein CJP74_00075 [Psittacicella melopsittaci]|uniref:ISXO2-like transposase domain-containing protein n=1 Tax=Psittacicella melopsittaci TaxID=2028576 RepID=A0A3A1YAG6_9GAMM|nr:transposase [Psittacicella melopsittaci]RIY34219.1 hypothetical protein CJP74_00075 [Psittacicella melopsittaci]